MPQQVLASQASADSSPRDQLNALAKLQARIRQGQPATAAELHFEEEDLQPQQDLYSCACQMCPAGDCALITWCDRGGYADDAMGAAIVGRDASGERWSCPCPLPDPSEDDFASYITLGWSRCGRYAATLSLLWAAGGSLASIFDAQKSCWLPSLHLENAEPATRDLAGVLPCIVFSDGSRPLAAARGCIMIDQSRALIVFGVAPAFVRVMPLAEDYQYLWLPGSECIALLHQGQLCRLDALDELHITHSHTLTPPALPLRNSQGASMAACDLCQGLWVAQALNVHPSASAGRFRVSVHAAADITCLGSWRLSVRDKSRHIVVGVSRRAIAVAFSAPCMRVYSRPAPLELGQLLFVTDCLQGFAFSPDGYWLLGAVQDAIRVLDARTGQCVACLPTAPCSTENCVCHDPVAAWGPTLGQVLVTCPTDEGLLFTRLQF